MTSDDRHTFPEGDFFEHEFSPQCPCSPSYATTCVAGRGYVMRWEHRVIQINPTPDCPPAELR